MTKHIRSEFIVHDSEADRFFQVLNRVGSVLSELILINNHPDFGDYLLGDEPTRSCFYIGYVTHKV